jgi:hypothetical protein|tara:strand:- start:524 stop:1075 length:552 start_codon:yes stop_codon:yes gene_type:complete
MQRDYATGYKDDVNVFSGLEIEHTPAYGKQTLFLARNDLTFDQIISLAVASDAEAVYFGANRSYMHSHAMQLAQIHQLLDRGYWVTVDYPYELHRLVSKKFATCWTHEKFIPFCSIIFPYTEDDKQLCFKVDDEDFNKTNTGVWSMSMADFKSKAGYTKWEEYKQDEPITEDKIWPAPVKQKA